MSRIGRKPIPVPAGVKIALQTGKIDVQGPKGKLSFAIPHGITFEQKDGVLTALRATEEHRALHGLARALVANAVQGVTSGFKKELDIVGVGYRAELKGKTVSFALGKSHPIDFPIPEGIQVAVEKQTHLVVSGADKGQVGQVAADMRSLRPPDPYKQKGVRITGERLRQEFASYRGICTASVSTLECAPGSRARRNAHACACTVRWGTFTRR
jgi:large subunit ribosomal protein L6